MAVEVMQRQLEWKVVIGPESAGQIVLNQPGAGADQRCIGFEALPFSAVLVQEMPASGTRRVCARLDAIGHDAHENEADESEDDNQHRFYTDTDNDGEDGNGASELKYLDGSGTLHIRTTGGWARGDITKT